MPKNILIFADGTGNESGLLPDESRTNVYKLYRATRTGPDTTIDPEKQIAFYIPGVGTPGVTPPSIWKRLWKSIEQAVGGGLTSQIADCYAAIISVWTPGDRIYLFGFSRGAYCVRCVAHVLEIIGVPTKEATGEPLSFEPRSLRTKAITAVKILYRLGLPQPNEVARSETAATFRNAHACVTGAEAGAIPFAVCIWDAVAAVGWLHVGVSKVVRWLPFVSSRYDYHFPHDIKFAPRHGYRRIPSRFSSSALGWIGHGAGWQHWNGNSVSASLVCWQSLRYWRQLS